MYVFLCIININEKREATNDVMKKMRCDGFDGFQFRLEQEKPEDWKILKI